MSLIVVLGLLCIYFLPTAIAFNRKHHNKIPILLVNLFFAWTVVMWLVTFIWSFSSTKTIVIHREPRID